MSSSRLSVTENAADDKTDFSVPEKSVVASSGSSAKGNGVSAPQSSRTAPSSPPVRENSGPSLSKLALPSKFKFSKPPTETKGKGLFTINDVAVRCDFKAKVYYLKSHCIAVRCDLISIYFL